MSDKSLRYNEGKAPVSYILTFPEAIKGVASVCRYGETKYARFNYLNKSLVTEQIDSLIRHLIQFYCGEDIDPESGQHHLDHLAWNAMRLSDQYKRGILEDDRPSDGYYRHDGRHDSTEPSVSGEPPVPSNSSRLSQLSESIAGKEQNTHLYTRVIS